MPTLGRKPALNNDAGVGEMGSGTIRASIMGSLSAAGWATRIGGRMGRSTGANATAALALYKATSTAITNRVAQTSTFAVSVYMDPSDRTTGTDYTQALTGVPISPGQIYAIALRCASQSISHGQDNSGHPMHFKTAGSFPDPYAAGSVSAQGKMSLWVEVTTNRKPNTPTVPSPASGAVTVNVRPPITVRHSDPDTVYGDYMKQYKVEIWNEANTTLIMTSGVLTATGPQQTAGEAIWTPGADLVAGSTYTIRANTYDYHGVASDPRTQKVTIQSGGAFSDVAMHPDDIAGSRSGNVITNTTSPRFVGTWEHEDSVDADSVTMRIRNMDTNTVYRADKTSTVNIIDGGTFTYGFADGAPTWSAMARGATRYRFEVYATDALGGISPVAQSPTFVVNATPGTPTALTPASGSVTELPTLRSTNSDANDGPENLSVSHEIRVSPAGTPVAVTATYEGAGVFRSVATPAQMPGYGTYDFRAVASDGWGGVGTSSWVTFTYTSPPVITNLYPAVGEVIVTAAPNISYTLDRTQAKHQITITAQGGSQVYYQSTVMPTSSTAHAVPSGKLRNNINYDLTIWIEAADGLTTQKTIPFRVQYEQPDPVEDATIENVQSSVYDSPSGTFPGQEPNVRLGWTPVSEATVSTTDWDKYLIGRTRLDREEPARSWEIFDRNQGEFVDTSPTGGALYEYRLQYVRKVNAGLDTVHSEPVTFTTAVVIRYTTITSEEADDPAVTFHFWNRRESDLITDVVVVEGWGEKPIMFQGAMNYEKLSGTFQLLDDDSGNDLYSAHDIVESGKHLATPITSEEDGKLRPRLLNLRDPTGRSIRGALTRFRVIDNHSERRADIQVEFTEHGA
jgi:hypothetical protein